MRDRNSYFLDKSSRDLLSHSFQLGFGAFAAWQWSRVSFSCEATVDVSVASAPQCRRFDRIAPKYRRLVPTGGLRSRFRCFGYPPFVLKCAHALASRFWYVVCNRFVLFFRCNKFGLLLFYCGAAAAAAAEKAAAAQQGEWPVALKLGKLSMAES